MKNFFSIPFFIIALVVATSSTARGEVSDKKEMDSKSDESFSHYVGYVGYVGFNNPSCTWERKRLGGDHTGGYGEIINPVLHIYENPFDKEAPVEIVKKSDYKDSYDFLTKHKLENDTFIYGYAGYGVPVLEKKDEFIKIAEKKWLSTKETEFFPLIPFLKKVSYLVYKRRDIFFYEPEGKKFDTDRTNKLVKGEAGRGSITLIDTKVVNGNLWLKVGSIGDIEPFLCGDPPEEEYYVIYKPYLWMRAFNDKGEPNFIFYVRGC